MRTLRVALGTLALLAAHGGAAAPAGTSTVTFACDGRPGTIAAMENEYVAATGKGACWFHLGHHTYDMGALYKVGAVSGSVYSVEVELSPPTEYTANGGAALSFEASRDGLVWTSLAQLRFNLLAGRQPIAFSFEAGGFAARYVRIRQPRSAAQGLAGYLDASGFTAEVEPLDATPPASSPQTRAYGCATGVMERFFDAHPCWFGGINRYDAPSVFHTYPIGPSTLDRVRGAASFFPWRTDDYTNSGGSRTDLTAYVQVSTDSVHWTTLGPMSGKYGVPIAFDLPDLGAIPASFVRLVAEYDKGYRNDPSLKHVRGMLLDSSLELTGVLPA